MKMLKKAVFLLALVATSFNFTLTARAATYNFRHGETLGWFIDKSGNTFEQLFLMNQNLTRDYKPEFWDEIHYLGQVDIDLAILWCEERAQDPELDKRNRKYFQGTAKRLRHKKIRWDVDTPEGIYYELILDFSKAWQEKYWQADDLLQSKKYGRVYTKSDGYYTVCVYVQRGYQGVKLTVSSDFIEYRCRIKKIREIEGFRIPKITMEVKLGGFWYGAAGGPDYFWPYKEWALTLPRSARKAFLGQYGVYSDTRAKS